ncbi:MAG: hypothetical protein IKK08_08865 [Clostridia bacterium]|nr:hypothetical protein [Clostridia bacterium]
METRFECSFETTKETVQEFSRYFHFHTAYILIPALAMLVLLGLTLYEIVCYGWYRQQLLQLILALVIFPALLLYRYKRDAKTILARSRELHGDKPAVSRTLFAEEEITLIDTDGNAHPFAYDNLQQVIVTKNLLLLRSKARQSILCEKEKFTKGTWTDCVAFLLEKGLKLRKG